jgi:signal transduction histidine kinase
VKSIVDAHSGEIKCESEVDKGTKFEVIIPQR